MGRNREICLLSLWLLGLHSCQFIIYAECLSKENTRHIVSTNENYEMSQSSPPVKLNIKDTYVVMDNGIVQITLHNPTGELTSVQYNGIDNLLESNFRELERGYWDIIRTTGREENILDKLEATNFKVIAQDNDKVEVSFSKTWNPSADEHGLPLNYDKRFILLSGSSGFYTYAIYEHLKGWPALNMSEGRLAFKLSNKLFDFMAVSDDMQTIMPNEHDLESGKTLDYKEATLLTNPVNRALKDQVNDKYQYSMEHKDDSVHGWTDSRSGTGFWVIIPSQEFRAGGPVKPELTAHAVSICLVDLFSRHYAGREMGVNIQEGQPWKKVFGPIFLYLNSDKNNDPKTLWSDAKRQMIEETRKWPYDFPLSPDYPHANERGGVTGSLMIQDRYISKQAFPANASYVGLAAPGEVGSWQKEGNGYQFWTQTDEHGYFNITNVLPGTYNLYAFVPGVIGDYKYNADIEIKPGSQISLNVLTFEPQRDGPTLWEIGIPDRTAAEFFIPDPNPGLRDHLYYINDKQKYRQYGLWSRYTDLYPKDDLVYTIGKSDYHTDWFFAHVARRVGGDGSKTIVPTTWQIKFELPNVNKTGTYTVRIALASASQGMIQVRINDPKRRQPNFRTDRIGEDSAIARHGIHGLYWLFSFQVPGSELVEGANTMYLKQSSDGPFSGVMYDYIRLEGPGGN